MPEPKEAAAITQGREEGWHGTPPRVRLMTPASHGCMTATIMASPAPEWPCYQIRSSSTSRDLLTTLRFFSSQPNAIRQKLTNPKVESLYDECVIFP